MPSCGGMGPWPACTGIRLSLGHAPYKKGSGTAGMLVSMMWMYMGAFILASMHLVTLASAAVSVE